MSLFLPRFAAPLALRFHDVLLLLLVLLLLVCPPPTANALLLSDLPTPCLVLDIPLLQRHLSPVDAALPPLTFPSSNDHDHHTVLLLPHDPVSHLNVDETAAPIPLLPDAAYIHCQVTRGRDIEQQDEIAFLAQLDSPANLQDVTQLVLGLNNHHVGSYYWARSAGAGAAMEAPGTMVDAAGTMRWKSKLGYTDCNSNDGKRSEWVNFLQKGDTVQLLLLLKYHQQQHQQESTNDNKVLSHEEAAIIQSLPVFGVSSKGRPMGSEPEVVCKWKWQS